VKVIITFVELPLNLLANENEWHHGLNWARQQQASGIRIAHINT